MRQENVLNFQSVRRGEGNVLVGIPLRVNYGCRACAFVPNQVGSVRQTGQIKLLQDHHASFSLTECYLGWGTIRRYGREDFQPPGYFCLASSSVTTGRM